MRNMNRRNTLLWHTMEEGTVSVKSLAALTGWTPLYSREAITKAVDADLMARAIPKAHPATYGLTPRGIVEAQKVERSEVEFAQGTDTSALVAETYRPLPKVEATGMFDQLCAAVGVGVTTAANEPEPSPEPVSGAVTDPAPTSYGWVASNDVPKVFEADDDLVCAINSKGELVIDLGGANNIVVQFPPKQALALQSFLDNTSLLYELSAKGQL